MALVMNATNREQHVVVFGNHFTLKPNQIKNFTDNIANFMCADRRDFGLVGLPEEFSDPGFAATDDGKRILAEKKAEGTANYIRRLKQIVYNAQVALRQDLEKANLKVDWKAFASDGEMAAMEELAKYQDAEDSKQADRVEKLKQLEARVGKVEKAR
jgi:hypothetical protein